MLPLRKLYSFKCSGIWAREFMDDMNWIEFHAIYGALGLWRMIEKRCSFSLMQCAIDTVWPFPGLCVSRRDCVGMERFMLHRTPIFLFEKGIMRMNSVIVHGFQHFHNVAWRFCSSNMLQWLKYIEKKGKEKFAWFILNFWHELCALWLWRRKNEENEATTDT